MVHKLSIRVGFFLLALSTTISCAQPAFNRSSVDPTKSSILLSVALQDASQTNSPNIPLTDMTIFSKPGIQGSVGDSKSQVQWQMDDPDLGFARVFLIADTSTLWSTEGLYLGHDSKYHYIEVEGIDYRLQLQPYQLTQIAKAPDGLVGGGQSQQIAYLKSLPAPLKPLQHGEFLLTVDFYTDEVAVVAPKGGSRYDAPDGSACYDVQGQIITKIACK